MVTNRLNLSTMRTPPNLPEILTFLSIPHSLQIEKLLREIYSPATAHLLDGINDIPQAGYVVALERRFHYDLDPKLGTSQPGSYYLNASFLKGIDLFVDDIDGIKIYFGLDTDQNKLVPILTRVRVTDPQNEYIITDVEPYYVPIDAQNGDWAIIQNTQFQLLRSNYKTAVTQINQPLELGGSNKYKIRGYYIGKDAITHVLSDAPPEGFGTTIVKAGIKLYFGIQDEIEFYDYETGKSKDVGGGLRVISQDRELHLILTDAESPNLGPLASFSRLFATLETDVQSIKEGVVKNHDVHRLTGSLIPCVVPDRDDT